MYVNELGSVGGVGVKSLHFDGRRALADFSDLYIYKSSDKCTHTKLNLKLRKHRK